MKMQRFAVALTIVNGAFLLGITFRERPIEAQATPAVVRARAIELVDERGQVRAQLNVEASGEAVFRMRDATGTIRVKIGASEDGSGLLLLDDSEEPAVHALAQRSGTSLTLARGAERQVLRP